MGKKLYVGNLPYSVTEDELRSLFSECGTIEEVAVIMDRETGRPKGFAFVTMSSDSEAQAAVSSKDGATVGDRQIKVNEARPREDRGGSGGGGRGRY